jgi:hypothetical protein
MRLIGSVKTLEQAQEQGLKAAKEQGCAFVYEKAKCKLPSGKYQVCYRGWLDLNDPVPRVVSYQEWKKNQT